MKQKLTIKTFLIAIAACFLSVAVILSSAHLKDVARAHSFIETHAATFKITDTVAKAIGDLHNHVDKQTLKAISMDQPAAARERELKALNEEHASRNVIEMLEEMILFYRFAFSLRFSLATT